MQVMTEITVFGTNTRVKIHHYEIKHGLGDYSTNSAGCSLAGAVRTLPSGPSRFMILSGFWEMLGCTHMYICCVFGYVFVSFAALPSPITEAAYGSLRNTGPLASKRLSTVAESIMDCPGSKYNKQIS